MSSDHWDLSYLAPDSSSRSQHEIQSQLGKSKVLQLSPARNGPRNVVRCKYCQINIVVRCSGTQTTFNPIPAPGVNY